MKIKHYILIILTLLTIAFMQPLVLLLGGITLIAGVLSFIYSDMSPENQQAWEAKIARSLQRLRTSLTKKNPPPAPIAAVKRQKLVRTRRQWPPEGLPREEPAAAKPPVIVDAEDEYEQLPPRLRR